MLDNLISLPCHVIEPLDPSFLQPIAERSAGRILHSPVLAEEAGERAVHQFILCCLAGRAPRQPESWIRVVARRCAVAIRRSPWSCDQPLDEERDLARLPSPEGTPRHAAADALLGRVQPSLTPRQNDALLAAREHRTNRGAATSCSMSARDFRRQLDRITRQARKALLDAPELHTLRNGLLGTDLR